MRQLLMRYRAILASSLLVTLAGCQTSQSITMPTKPILDVQVQTDGGMCLSAKSTASLATYIVELERTINNAQ